MFWILKFVCLCVRLFGFNVEIWCLCVIFDSGLFWFMNWESWDELKNFLIVVEIGLVLIRFCGIMLFRLFKFRCFLIVCLICIRLMWNWFFVILFIEWIWWLFRWLMLFILFLLLWIIISCFIIEIMFFLFSVLVLISFLWLRWWLNFMWLIEDRL